MSLNKQIVEIKKKIQLSEGQRKAHFEACESERRRNVAKLKQLKKELKRSYEQLGAPIKVEQVCGGRSRSAKGDLHSLRRTSPERAIGILDLKVIEVNKRRDLCAYERTKAEEKLLRLEEERDRLQSEREASGGGGVMHKPPDKQRTCSLENQIHQRQLSAMEAEAVRRKYRAIRSGLLREAARHEELLRQAELQIRQQQRDTAALQAVRSEALSLRDCTRGTLQRHEAAAARKARERDRTLQEYRREVEEQRGRLETLERRLFPAGGGQPLQAARDSLGGSQENLAAPQQASLACPAHLQNVEEHFKKLMVATGEVEAEVVRSRFLGQKETRGRLTYLRGLTEQDKRRLEETRSELAAQLEAAKFAAQVQDKEQDGEEAERLKGQLAEAERRLTAARGRLQQLQSSRALVMAALLHIASLLKDVGPALPSAPERLEAADLLTLVRDKGLSVRRAALLRQEQGMLQRERTASRPSVSQAPQQSSQEQAAGKESENEEEEETEIPTRGFLKRQAQVIVDAKSRRRFFRPSKQASKPKLHLRN